MEQLALHEGTSFLNNVQPGVAARDVAVLPRLSSWLGGLCEVQLILVVRAAGDLPV